MGLSRRELARLSGLSLRFLALLESSGTNISVARLLDLAEALGANPAALLAEAYEVQAAQPPRRKVALLGVRGAGKTTVGSAVAERLGAVFVELDSRIEERAGLSLGELFAVHGESYYRRLTLELLPHVLDAEGESLVLAAGGGIVEDPVAFGLLQRETTTVWLKASPQDHWRRVIDQGDRRPMANNPNAMSELEALLETRAPLYRRARHTIDTSGRSIPRVVDELVERLT